MSEETENMQNVTSFADLERYMKGQFVRLPDFAEGMPFCAKIKRPSMLALAKAKKIPNTLLATANQLFSTGVDFSNTEVMDDLYGLFDVICEATFVQPSWTDLKAHGIQLTDDQYAAIFEYTQQGVKALEPFREQSGDNQPSGDVKDVQQVAVGDNAH